MRKGTKRKATQKAAPKSKDQKNEPSQSPVEETKPNPNAEPETEPSKIAAGKGGRKRAKVASPEAETEYFPEKSNLEDLWLQVFPVGTEWDMLDKIYQYKWNFSNLKEALEEGGELHNKKVYIFCSTEAQFDDDKGQSQMTIIPVVVVVVSPFPPSDKIGIASVQRENEQIVPMKQMKMDWVPYIPLENRVSQVERLKNSQIFILSCNQRRAGLKHLKIERLKMFEYCLPYFYNPFQEDELEQSTVVDLIFPMDPMPIVCEFDWELDELEEFTDQLIEAEELPEDQKETFKDYVKQKVREGKKANREEREARKKAREALSQQSRAAFENIKFYKFYPVPTPDTPDISKKSDIINRYYGKAHKVI